MVITIQKNFPHISSQVDNKELKPVEKLKTLNVIIDKETNLASLQIFFEQDLVSCSMGILVRAKEIIPQFVLQHLIKNYYL